MTEKNKDYLYPLCSLGMILLLWQLVCSLGLVSPFLLPSPLAIFNAFRGDFWLLADHLKTTLLESVIGLFFGVLLGFVSALLMDRWKFMYKGFYPLVVLTQTVPTVAIAPLLVLWFGYEMLPKIILIVIVTFFPVTVGLLEGFKAADPDEVNLLKSMGAGEGEIFRYIKFPSSLGRFFAALRISASYAVVGGVISEWLGGFKGLGVYMTRVRKAYAFDKMFAVIFMISLISLLFIKLTDLLQKKCMPWEEVQNEKKMD